MRVETFRKILLVVQGIGVVLFWLAAASMDSEQLLVPVIVMLIGGTFMVGTQWLQKELDEYLARKKKNKKNRVRFPVRTLKIQVFGE